MRIFANNYERDMKKILYISNIEVPYRVQFFNELAKHCELTVLYERRKSDNRNQKWTESVRGSYRTVYLGGIRFSKENALSLKIFKYITGGYDVIVVGCVNSPIQILAMWWMRLIRIPYILNLDGEIHMGESNLKNWLKLVVLKGASKYVVAGNTAARSLKKILSEPEIVPYNFSSLTEEELAARKAIVGKCERNNTVLVVGQYFDYKGMDVALEAARMDPSISYKFVGMGNRTELFRRECCTDELPNVELIPFLQKEELNREYQRCAMLVLPSRKECWGLVINEAASFGMPIVSTWGSGAAVEFISEKYPQYLAAPGDVASLLDTIRQLRSSGETEEYSCYLEKKTQNYCIESICQTHLYAFGIKEEKNESACSDDCVTDI